MYIVASSDAVGATIGPSDNAVLFAGVLAESQCVLQRKVERDTYRGTVAVETTNMREVVVGLVSLLC